MDDKIQKPLITTIIPTYRRPKLLRRAIKSVLNQTYPHFQVCVYDNASGDETAEVVAEFAKKDPRVKYHCHLENIGALKNFNYGMAHVNTPFFSFLSDDDILLPEFYETAMEGFKKYPETIFSSTLTLRMDNQGNIWDSFSSNWMPGVYHPPQGLLAILKNGSPTWTGILYRREIIERVGILDSEGGISADLDFELRTVAHFPFVISLKPGAIFVFHPESAWEKAGSQDIWPGWLKTIHNLTEDKDIPLEVRNCAEYILEKRLKKMLFSFGRRAILQRNAQNTYEIVAVLSSHYHLKKRAFLISTIAKICRYFPPVYYYFVLLNKSRNFFAYRRRRKRSQNLYKSYKNILTIIGEYR